MADEINAVLFEFLERGKKVLGEPTTERGEIGERRRRRRRVIAEAREQKYPRGTRALEDPYRIGPIGGSSYSSAFKILEIHANHVYLHFKLLGRSEEVDLDKYKEKCVRIGEFELSWNCCSKYTDKIARKAGGNALIRVRVIVLDYYDNRELMEVHLGLDTWFGNKAREAGERISDTECGDWNSNFEGCHRRVEEIDKKEICPCRLLRADIADIEVMLKEIKENLDNIDYVLKLVEDIDKILIQNGCTKKNIKTLVERFGLENARIEGKLILA